MSMMDTKMLARWVCIFLRKTLPNQMLMYLEVILMEV